MNDLLVLLSILIALIALDILAQRVGVDTRFDLNEHAWRSDVWW